MLRERTTDLHAAWDHAKEQFLSIFVSECFFWVPFQLINFYYVPPR